MKMTFTLCFCALCCLFLTACASVPNGGFYGDVTKAGNTGPVLGVVQVGEGMLVRNIKLKPATEINIQINEDDPLLFENVLTIGKFSELLGSGFTKKENIYYEKRIHNSGKDFFAVKGKTYLVEWKCDYKDARTHLVSDHYTVTVREFTPLRASPPMP